MMPDIPDKNTKGTKTAKVVRVDAMMAVDTSIVPSTAASMRDWPGLSVTEDVLENDDGVVDQHPHSECQPAERHGVEREIVVVEQCEGGDDGHRNGDSDDKGAADVPEEDEQDEDGQNERPRWRRCARC